MTSATLPETTPDALPRAAGRAAGRAFRCVSVVIPVAERPRPLDQLYREYAPVVRALDAPFEFVFVISPWGREMARPLGALFGIEGLGL